MNPNGSLYPNLSEFQNYNSTNTQSSDTNKNSLYSNLYINPQYQGNTYVTSPVPPMYTHPNPPTYPQYNYYANPTHPSPPIYSMPPTYNQQSNPIHPQHTFPSNRTHTTSAIYSTPSTAVYNHQPKSDPIPSAPITEEVEEDEEPEERLSHSESLSKEWRTMDRVLKKSDRIITRFEHSMQRKNKAAALQAKEQVEKELKTLSDKYPKESQYLVQRITVALDYFQGPFQEDIKKQDQEKEQTLANYRNAVVGLRQEVEEANQSLNELLKNKESN